VAGVATVLRLESGRVSDVASARQPIELRELLGLAATPATP